MPNTSSEVVSVNTHVRHIDLAHSPEHLKSEILSWPETPRFLHVAHSPYSAKNANIIRIARKSEEVRDVLNTLCNVGLFTYMSDDSETRLVQHATLPRLWNPVRDGEFLVSRNGIFYKLEQPLNGGRPKRLLVVMSSIHGNMYTSSLMRHFMQNFPSIGKFVPKDTLILRIADIGGVCGAFYLNTSFLPHNVDNIQRLISDIGTEYDIGRDHRVLYGGSKGGTGALYHAMVGGYRCVSVDPIVSDVHYVETYNDSHFTEGGIFPESKQSVFTDLVDHFLRTRPRASSSQPRLSVIYSERSPQFKYITSTLAEPLAKHASFFNSLNPAIHDHPDVSVQTINIATMLMNGHLNGLQFPAGVHVVS